MGEPPVLGVVVPTLDESSHLPLLLEDLRGLRVPVRVVVADGGSVDDTIDAAREGGATVVRARRGRATQMNAGAAVLDTPWLFFVHGDCRLPPEALRALEDHVRHGDDQAGYFRFAVSDPGGFFRLLEWGQRLREGLLGLVYGDQGLVLPRSLFQAVGGFPDEPLMEDVLLTKKLAGMGRLARLSAPLETSPRRYLEEGRLRAVLRNGTNLVRFLGGASPSDLAPSYPPHRACHGPLSPPNDPTRRALLVFAKAPRPGAVKTRLARDVGEAEAARLYETMVRATLEELRHVPAHLVLCYDPPDGRRELEVLGGDRVDAWASQGSGDLGDRMNRMLEWALGNAGSAVVVGTDAPSLDRHVVERAFEALGSADLVLGPASDGGYYLLGLHRPEPHLFDRISWSTPTVLAETLERAAELGLRVTLLEVLRDVDTAADLTPELAAALAGGVPAT